MTERFQPNQHQEQSSRSGAAVPWSSVWQLGLSLLGILIFWGLAVTLLLIVISSSVDSPGPMEDSLALLLMGAGFAFVGVLLIPSAFLASIRLLQKPLSIPIRMPRPGTIFALLPVLIGLGYLVAQSSVFAWLLLPPIHVMVIGIAILWMIALGIRGLPTGSAQRQWGVFNTGMVAAPFLSLVMETVVIIIVGIIGIAYLGRSPGFTAELSQLYERYATNPNLSLDVIIETLQPYLEQPVVVYGGLVVVALLVPLIEELIKPIGVWLLAGRKLTPAQGFTAGVLSGGGFALFENLTLSASSGEEWAMVVIARIGTSSIHIITTGLTGWALALAWSQKKYFRLGATYLVVVTIHALWNGLVVLSIIPELLPDLTSYPDILRNIGLVSPFGFFVLLVGSFILLVGCNLALRRAIIPPAGESANEMVLTHKADSSHQPNGEISPDAGSEGKENRELAEEE